jgi:hypothetical protein
MPLVFFFFFSLTSPATTADPAVTYHFRQNHLRQLSSFLAKPNLENTEKLKPNFKNRF